MLQNEKIGGVKCSINELKKCTFRTQNINKKEKYTAKTVYFWYWWRWAELNRRVALRPKGFLRTYPTFDLLAKQPIGGQPAQKFAKDLRFATNRANRMFIA